MNAYSSNLADTKTLIQRCIEKDRLAWAHFVGLYQGLIRSSVYQKLDIMNLCSRRHEVPDIVQEIFLAIWEKDKLSGLKEIAALKGWLVVMAKNATVTYFRKRLNNNDAGTTMSFDEEFIPDFAYCPNEHIELDDSKEILKGEIAKLNPKHRLALTLSVYNCEKQKDIAETMGIPPNTVASLIRRAKNQIRKTVKECYA